jgi:hypothetical protein
MSIQIAIDPTYPKFAALPLADLKKVSISIGPCGMNTAYPSYDSYPLNFGSVGDSGVNPLSWSVSYTRPLTFSREAFGVFGNVTVTDFASSRLATVLSDYVKKGALKVLDAGVPLTPAQILTFVP